MANLIETRREQMFPKLTPAQIDRLEAYGKRLRIRAGEVLTEPGDRHGRILVVLSGAIEVVLPGIAGETPVTVHTAGSFAGEMSALRGSGATVRARVREDGEVIAIEHEGLLRVVQNDAELSELFMRAFILRRMGLIPAQQGDVVLIGSSHSAATLRLRQFLGRNGFPYASLDVDRDPDVAALLERFQVGIDEVPVVICRGEAVLRNPTNEQLVECLRMNPEFDDATVRDLIVIGAGPAGLAAAVYGASEGLDVLVLETTAPGGQAGTSSKIENYLGFPTGISGQALAGRALVQAQKFGADVAVAGTVVRLLCHRRPYRIELANGRVVHARTIVVATGAEYRPLAIENLSQFVGAGVYYAATYLEAQICRGEEAIVVGGGNSAGPGGGLPRERLPARAPARPVVGAGGDDVALPDPAHRGEPQHHAAAVHRDRRARGERAARAGHLAEQGGEREARDDRPRVPDDRCGAERALAGRLGRPRREGVRAHRIGSARRGSRGDALAARPGAVSPGDEPSGDLRGRRRARGQHQARRGRGGRGIDRGPVRPPRAAGIGLVHLKGDARWFSECRLPRSPSCT